MGNSDEGRRYIAYRCQADYFEIEFFGGPLDGSTISTDIFPDTNVFAHRIRGRSYFYEFRRIGKARFRAEWHGFEKPKHSGVPHSLSWWQTCLHWLRRLVSKASIR